MQNDQLIRGLIRNTVQRAFREIGACLLILAVFGSYLPHLRAGSARQYGCVLILVAALLIAGMTWAFTLSDKLLAQHPPTDSAFWHRIFLGQARLLRLVPLWYLAPLAIGLVLFSLPSASNHLSGFYANLGLVIVLFAGLTWLNRFAAAKLEEQAQKMIS